MPVTEFRSNILPNLNANAVIGGDGTTAAEIVDLNGYGEGISLTPVCLAYTTGTFDFIVEESDDSSMAGATAVPADQIYGTLAALQKTAATAVGDDLVNIALLGTKRYVRMSIVGSGTSVGTIAIFVERGGNLRGVQI